MHEMFQVYFPPYCCYDFCSCCYSFSAGPPTWTLSSCHLVEARWPRNRRWYLVTQSVARRTSKQSDVDK